MKLAAVCIILGALAFIVWDCLEVAYRRIRSR